MPRFSSAAISATSTDREITTYCLATTRKCSSKIIDKTAKQPHSNHQKKRPFWRSVLPDPTAQSQPLDVIRIDVNRHEPHTVSLIFTAAKLLHQVM